MLRVGVGQSSNRSTDVAAREAATQAMSRAGLDQADAALVFFSVDHVAEATRLTSTLRQLTKTERIVGCSGAGILTGEGEIEGGSGLAVMVLASDMLEARPFFFRPLRDREREIAASLAQAVPKGSDESTFAVLLPDTYHGQPRRLLQEIGERVASLQVVGAGCSEDGSLGKTYQLAGDQIATDALAGMVLSGSFHTFIGITQGCQPIASPMEITRAEGNFIFEIDRRPAFEVFSRILKPPLLDDLRRALAFVFVGLPSDSRRNSVDAGQYVVRNIVGLDPERGIVAVAEEVREGQKVIFTLRDGPRAREDLEQMLERQRENLRGKTPRLGLYFNCCARGASLYKIPGIDTAYIRKALGEFPLIGFFGNFEMGPLGEANRLLAYTGVLVLITER